MRWLADLRQNPPRTRWRVGCDPPPAGLPGAQLPRPQPAPFANPAPAHRPNGSPPRSDRGIGGCVSRCAEEQLQTASSALITSGGRCLPSVASWLSARSTLASHPWRVAASAARSAIASPRLDSTKPTADAIDQATQPSHSTRPAIARMWKRLLQRLSANNGAAILKTSAATLATA